MFKGRSELNDKLFIHEKSLTRHLNKGNIIIPIDTSCFEVHAASVKRVPPNKMRRDIYERCRFVRYYSKSAGG